MKLQTKTPRSSKMNSSKLASLNHPKKPSNKTFPSRTSKKTFKAFASILILLTLATALIFYIKNHITDFKTLELASPQLIIALITIFIFTYFLSSRVTKSLIKPLGVNLNSKESFLLSIVTGFYNLITPFKGGMATRAIYLKKKHNFTYTNFLASLAGMYVITFLIASLTGIISTLIIYQTSNIFSLIIFLIFCAMFFPLLILTIISPKFNLTKNEFLNKFIKVINGWNLIKNNKRVILTISLISFLQLLLGASMLYLQFQVFGLEIAFVKCLFLASIGSLAVLIAITPAGLGISEAVTVFSAITIGILPAQALSVALLGRAIQMITLFVLGPLFSISLIKYSPQKK